jgi:hypothetical protein
VRVQLYFMVERAESEINLSDKETLDMTFEEFRFLLEEARTKGIFHLDSYQRFYLNENKSGFEYMEGDMTVEVKNDFYYSMRLQLEGSNE